MALSDATDLEIENAYGVFENEINAGKNSSTLTEKEPVDKLVPYFISLTKRDGIKDVVQKVAEPNAEYYIEENELDFLTTILQFTETDPFESVNVFLYSKLSKIEFVEKFKNLKILKVGQKIEVDLKFAKKGKNLRPGFNKPTAHGQISSVIRPISAIVDDGIGFLNYRFCNLSNAKTRTTRIHDIWIQAGEEFSKNKSDPLTAGETLSHTEIDKLLDRIDNGLMNEGDIYRRYARKFSGKSGQSQLVNARSHGTHVLDLFAGKEPEPPKPGAGHVLAVQLPPRSIRQSNGSLFEQSFLQALNWIFQRALKMAIKGRQDLEKKFPNFFFQGKVFYPVVVNASLGILAGSKTGNDFLTTQILAYARRYERLTELILGAASPVRIVFPYGNSYESRQVAYASFEGETQKRELNWDLLPDDRSPSYLEIRPAENTKFDLTLVSTGGTEFKMPSKELPCAGQTRKMSLTKGGPFVGQIFGLHEDGRDWYLVALCPTRKDLSDSGSWSVATNGAWKLVLENKSETNHGEISLQIQRDDTPGAYRLLGRQSRFAGGAGKRFDYETGKTSNIWYYEQRKQEMVTCEGTHSARLPGPDFPEGKIIYGVGAAVKTGQSVEMAASYSGMGSKHNALTLSHGPDLSAYASLSPQGLGRIGAGTQSGSVGFSHGTSVSAPLVARELLEVLVQELREKYDRNGSHAVLSSGQPIDDDDTHRSRELSRILPDQNIEESRDPRLGHGVVRSKNVGAIGFLSTLPSKGHI